MAEKKVNPKQPAGKVKSRAGAEAKSSTRRVKRISRSSSDPNERIALNHTETLL